MNLWTKRGLAVAIGTVAALSPVAGAAVMQSIEQGSWTCCICGRSEERTVLCGLVLSWEMVELSQRRYDVQGGFHQWFERSVRFEHTHDWIPVGCHWVRGVDAYMAPLDFEFFYRSLPALPDQQLARELVAHLIARDTEARRAMLSDLQRDPGPFADVLEEPAITSAEFATAYETWSAAHPLWR